MLLAIKTQLFWMWAVRGHAIQTVIVSPERFLAPMAGAEFSAIQIVRTYRVTTVIQ